MKHYTRKTIDLTEPFCRAVQAKAAIVGMAALAAAARINEERLYRVVSRALSSLTREEFDRLSAACMCMR